MAEYRITANWDQLVDDAKRTTDNFFHRALHILRNAEVEYTTADVIALANSMGYEFRTTAIVVAAQNIEDALDRLTQTLDSYITEFS